VEPGDRIVIDIPARRLHLDVGDEELARRRASRGERGWQPARPRPRRVSAALRAYALLAGGAEEGAVRTLPADQ
jgi:dihydroxy-acid dehydratase